MNASKRTVESMCDIMCSLCLVKECKELEEVCGMAHTEKMNDEIKRVDHEKLLKRCTEKAPLIAEVEKRVSWDTALNFWTTATWDCEVSRPQVHVATDEPPWKG